MIRESTELLIANRFEAVSLLGQGSSASVYRALDRALRDEPVALKIIHRRVKTNDDWLERFKREVSIARRLSHPNIVRIFDFGELPDGSCFATMELVEGGDLYSKIRASPGGRCDLIPALQILLQTAMALDYAHKLGVIHRDMKPANILIDAVGYARISDFGSARQPEVDAQLTPIGDVIGTPHYMPPELFKGDTLSPLVDIYSLGIVLYEMLAGAPPFNGDSTAAIVTQHIRKPMPLLSATRTDTPKWCDEIIQTCTEKNPRDRYPSVSALAGEVLDQLSALNSIPPLPTVPDSLLDRLTSSQHHHKSLLKRLFS
jgi:serine/threonine protein kinase